MRMDYEEITVGPNQLMRTVIVLSERNVRALYHKLTMPGSRRTIIAPDGAFAVTIEDDTVHYLDREHPPGEMHALTERFIQEDQGGGI